MEVQRWTSSTNILLTLWCKLCLSVPTYPQELPAHPKWEPSFSFGDYHSLTFLCWVSTSRYLPYQWFSLCKSCWINIRDVINRQLCLFALMVLKLALWLVLSFPILQENSSRFSITYESEKLREAERCHWGVLGEGQWWNQDPCCSCSVSRF